jgi:hypothetical protein
MHIFDKWNFKDKKIINSQSFINKILNMIDKDLNYKLKYVALTRATKKVKGNIILYFMNYFTIKTLFPLIYIKN